jgi:magnesium-protoporphyrin IX monomethyl ester (oxidative) cyclase
MSSQRILLIQTTVDDSKTVPYWGYFRTEPGVSWVAAAINEPDWEVEVIDGDQEIDSSILTRIVNFAPTVIGFSCFTAGFPRALRLAREAKRQNPDVFCLFGGWHPSLVPNEVIKESCVDAVGVGQGERFINAFLKSPECFRNCIIRADSFDFVERSTPMRGGEARFAEFNFLGAQPLEQQRAATIVLSSGGCVFRCTYCCTPTIYGKGTPRQLDLVIADIQNLIEEHGVNFIFIRDEDPPVYKEFLERFCGAMVQTGLNRSVRLYSFGDTRLMTQALLEKMAKAGWIGLDYGVESFDLKQLRSLRRSPNLTQTGNVFRWTQEAGIFTTANVILWQPGDGIDCFTRTEEALRWLQPDEAMPLFFTPFPGTHDAGRYENYAKRTTQLEDYHLLTPVLELDASIASDELMELRRNMLNNYYSSREYANLIQFRKQQFGDAFWSLTQVRRDRLLRHGLDIWNLEAQPTKELSQSSLPQLRQLAVNHAV